MLTDADTRALPIGGSDALNILALDVASTTGIAELSDGSSRFYAEQFASKDDDDPAIARRVMHWAAMRFKVTRFNAVYLEAPLNFQNNMSTARRLLLLRDCFLAAVAAKGIKYREVSVHEIRDAFIGTSGRNINGDEAKLRVQMMCKLIGWRTDTPDQADAGAVLWYAARREGVQNIPKVTPDMWARVAEDVKTYMLAQERERQAKRSRGNSGGRRFA